MADMLLNPDGPWRAGIDRNYRRFDPLGALEIWLYQRSELATTIGLPAELTFRTIEAGSPELAEASEPTLRLSEPQARALLDALAAYFGGSSDVQRLNADLAIERGRVDRLIEHLAASTPMALPEEMDR